MKVQVTFDISDDMKAAIMYRHGWKKATRGDIAAFIDGLVMADLELIEEEYHAFNREEQ
jgi:hypothetical protein